MQIRNSSSVDANVWHIGHHPARAQLRPIARERLARSRAGCGFGFADGGRSSIGLFLSFLLPARRGHNPSAANNHLAMNAMISVLPV